MTTIRNNYDERERQNTTSLEEALLAASDGIQNGGRRLASKTGGAFPLRFKPQESGEWSHGHTQGMDFIAVRKEILNELKQQRGDRTSKLSANKLAAEKSDWID